MSLLDANISRLDNQKNISLPPISSIIKSIDQQPLVQNVTNQNSKDTLIQSNHNIPTLIPNISTYPYQKSTIITNTNDYTYNTVKSNSQDSITASPSVPIQIIPQPYIQHQHQPQVQSQQITYGLPITQTLQIPQQLHHDPSLSPSQPHSHAQSTPSPTLSSTSPTTSTSSATSSSASQLPSSTKRKYTCKTCTKSFTTSGHLARHSRIHTGERKHVCPYPNCQSRFARQDNCMQHYKTHLNNKLRRRKYTKRV